MEDLGHRLHPSYGVMKREGSLERGNKSIRISDPILPCLGQASDVCHASSCDASPGLHRKESKLFADAIRNSSNRALELA